jgi:hypothetical protein
MTMRPLAAATAVVLSLGLAACGGGDSTSSGSASASMEGSSAESQTSMTPSPSSEGKGEKKRASGKQGSGGEGSRPGSSGHHVDAAPLKVTGGGSAQFEVSGGDNSVQEYGAEAGESELREAAEAVHSFYVARLGGEWALACSDLSRSTAEGLQQLAEKSPQLKGKGCAGGLDAFTKPLSPSLQRQLTTLDAAALRTEGEQAFLIYTGPPGRTVYAMPLRSEGGEWKLGAITAAALPGAK